MHSGCHYCSTAIEWKYLIDAIEGSKEGDTFIPKVSLDDGIKAVEMGICRDSGGKIISADAHSSKSSENLLNHVMKASRKVATEFVKEVVDDCVEDYGVYSSIVERDKSHSLFAE